MTRDELRAFANDLAVQLIARGIELYAPGYDQPELIAGPGVYVELSVTRSPDGWLVYIDDEIVEVAS
jgi:hypothetical protein